MKLFARIVVLMLWAPPAIAFAQNAGLQAGRSVPGLTSPLIPRDGLVATGSNTIGDAGNTAPLFPLGLTSDAAIAAQHMPGIGIATTQSYMRYSESGGLNTNTWLNAPVDFDLTNLANNLKRGITMNVRTNSSMGKINTGGIAISIYTPPDNGGDTSGIWVNQIGGGNALSVFNLCGDVPRFYKQYCKNGRAIEATVDGSKSAIVTSVKDGVAYIAHVTGTAGGTGFYAYPKDDTDFSNNRAFRVSNAENTVEDFFVTMGGKGYFRQEVNSRKHIIQGPISSPFWGENGLQLQGDAAKLTDTSSQGVAGPIDDYVFKAPILATANPVTYASAATVAISGPPKLGPNVSVVKNRALTVESGMTQLNGGLSVAGGTVTLSGLSAKPRGKQPLCIDTSSGRIYAGSGGSC
ncbi:MAG TPA: hypothetical protein VHY10_00665 [Xanthobacteraceae bacterium]|nr:hypothetical protein [Xanthobacteraceae bacterium]